MGVVLITGASSGIGLELAHQFAKHGHNVLLTARRERLLVDLQEALEQQYSIKAYVYAADLSLARTPALLHKWVQDQGLEVQYLVNNAGFGDCALFKRGSWERYEQNDSSQYTSSYPAHTFVFTSAYSPAPCRNPQRCIGSRFCTWARYGSLFRHKGLCVVILQKLWHMS